jgi:putative membrane protein
MMGFGWVFGLAFLIVAGWLILKTTRQTNDTGSTGNRSALEILKERYARGEINQDEFREKKDEIQI